MAEACSLDELAALLALQDLGGMAPPPRNRAPPHVDGGDAETIAKCGPARRTILQVFEIWVNRVKTPVFSLPLHGERPAFDTLILRHRDIARNPKCVPTGGTWPTGGVTGFLCPYAGAFEVNEYCLMVVVFAD